MPISVTDEVSKPFRSTDASDEHDSNIPPILVTDEVSRLSSPSISVRSVIPMNMHSALVPAVVFGSITTVLTADALTPACFAIELLMLVSGS